MKVKEMEPQAYSTKNARFQAHSHMEVVGTVYGIKQILWDFAQSSQVHHHYFSLLFGHL
jgi:hypothetical protein